jgi:aminoglycoside phosphotransferase (APT) family kinase protein
VTTNAPKRVGRMNDPLRRSPPDYTLRWATDAIGPGSRIGSLRRLTHGSWHANHALTVIDAGGVAHRLVLRRWARPEWAREDPDFTPAREATVLELLVDTPVPAPRLVAADPDGAVCDVPTLLVTRLSGSPPGLPRDIETFLAQLAEALPAIHAIDDPTLERIPAYRATTTSAPPRRRRGRVNRNCGSARSNSLGATHPPDAAALSTATFTPRTRSGPAAG